MSDFIRLKVKFSSKEEIEDGFGAMDSIFRKEYINSIYEINYNGKKTIVMAYSEYTTKGNQIVTTYEILDETMDSIMNKLEEGDK